MGITVLLRLSLPVLLGLPLIAASSARPMDEYQVKAAFLYNFARFVEWPQEAFQDANDPFAICVLGQDPFGRALDDVAAGKKIEGRAVAVRRISEARRANGCRILFVSSSEPKRVLATLASMSERGVLTVGEADNATSEGMIIDLTLEEGKVRFEIHTEAAGREKLRFSSKLLSLATILKK
jgi:YfiR/HmsC-like